MRIDIKETKVYPFDELSNDVQKKVIEDLADINVNYDWWKSAYEDAAAIGLKIMKFDIDCNRYCWGDWMEEAEDTARLIIEQHGKHCETYKNAVDFLAEYEKQNETWKMEVLKEDDPDYMRYEESDEYHELAEEFRQTICEDYRLILQKEYDYLTSEEMIMDTIQANEYEFTEDGNLY